MSEWWTYRLSDFLMFSPRTYWRLIELHNRDVWPAQLVALAAGLVLLWLAGTRRAGAGRVLAALLAAIWLWVGWAFHWQHYATINSGAQYFALAFAIQAVLLVGLGTLPRDAHAPTAGVVVQNLGWLLAVTGVLLYPLAGLLAGRPWTQPRCSVSHRSRRRWPAWACCWPAVSRHQARCAACWPSFPRCLCLW